MRILQLLRDINRRLGLTVVLITHEMEVIRAACDRVADPKLMSLHERCELEARQGKAREAFLVALGKLDAMQVHVSHSPKAGNFGPKEMIARGLVDGFAKGELVEAMDRLLGDGLIRANEPVGWSGNRNRLTGLRRVAP